MVRYYIENTIPFTNTIPLTNSLSTINKLKDIIKLVVQYSRIPVALNTTLPAELGSRMKRSTAKPAKPRQRLLPRRERSPPLRRSQMLRSGELRRGE